MNPEDVPETLGEKYSLEILRETHEPRSARELSDQLNVPIATCYRRIEALVEAGLLEEKGRELSDRGRRSSVYKRTFDEIVLTFEEDDLTLSTGNVSRARVYDRMRD